MQVRRSSNQQRIQLSTELGSGGEGKIYTLVKDPSLVAKLYHPTQRTPRHGQKLQAMLTNPPNDPAASQGYTSIAWPIDLLQSDTDCQIVGFLMRRIDRAYPLHNLYNPGTRRSQLPFFTYQTLHRVARNLAAVVAALHARDYVIGDVNESNILVNQRAMVTLVDTDSFQVPDLVHGLHRCPVGKPEFTPPELQGQPFREVDRRPEHDRFGLAVLLYQLLMEGTHPFEGLFDGPGEPPPKDQRISLGYFPHSKRPVPCVPKPIAPAFSTLHPSLRTLFLRCFEEGHFNSHLRPTAQTWVKVLELAEHELIPCKANPFHRYGQHLPHCPWCERQIQLGGRDPFPGKVVAYPSPNQPARSAVSVDPRSTSGLRSLFVPPPTPRRWQPGTPRTMAGAGITLLICGFIGYKALEQTTAPSVAERPRLVSIRPAQVTTPLPTSPVKSATSADLPSLSPLYPEPDPVLPTSKITAYPPPVEPLDHRIEAVYHDILALAAQEYQAGRLDVALNLARTIPSQSPLAAVAEQQMRQWQAEWTVNANRVRTIQMAFIDEQWQRVLEETDRLPQLPYWRSQVSRYVDIATQQLTQPTPAKPERLRPLPIVQSNF